MAMQGISKMTASAEEPAVAGSSPSVPVADVFAGSVVDPPPSSEYEMDHDEGAVLGGDEADDLSDADYNIYLYLSIEDEDYYGNDVDSDSEFEEDDEVLVPVPVPVPPKVKHGDVTAAICRFLGKLARFATVQSTVCFVNLAASWAPLSHHGGEIIVDYRYTGFVPTQSGVDDMHFLGPKPARLRFVLASPLSSEDSDSDPVTTAMVSSSLRFAGAVLASLVYPTRFSAQLQALWSVATVPVRVPARATRLVVTVDAGILRSGDFTAARMRRMCAALESVAYYERAVTAAAKASFDIAAQLHLPALLVSEDDVRPAKRRRVTGEDCPICCEVLEERGGLALAAWPRCSHIFHAGCLEQHLLRGFHECPLRRSELNVSPALCGK